MSDSHPKARSIRVLLVDDNPMLRQALRSALEVHANIEVVGEASDGEQALVCVAKLQPTVVVMDINLPKMDGITATRLIKAQYPQIAVGLSVETKDYLLYSMQRVGASEVVHKENAAGTLYGAIQKAVAAFNRFSSWKRRRSRGRRLKNLLNHQPSVWTERNAGRPREHF